MSIIIPMLQVIKVRLRSLSIKWKKQPIYSYLKIKQENNLVLLETGTCFKVIFLLFL